MPTPLADTPTPPTPMETMANERKNPPFDLRRMTYAMGDGEKEVKLREKHMMEIQRNPLFRLDDIHDFTKDQLRERTMAKFSTLVSYVTSERIDEFQKRMNVVSLADPGFWTRFVLHFGLFLGAIRSGATANQMSYWMSKGLLGLNGMIGCFGMTELAHGSNVAGLETTATFDEQTDEFVIHTPSVSATKWWIGGAAHSATHCSVFAQLIVKGQVYGTKTFIVPLRDPKTYQLLPGVAIGDIGKKMGRDGIDNGWIQFTNVRIPRAYMLMKHTQVTRDGEVREPPLAQLTYGALLQGRTAMVADAANVAKKALTIAIRYAAVRRQFKVGENELETQLLDYPIHQRRLLPLLSQAVAMGFTSYRMTALFEEMSGQLESLGSDSDEAETKEVLEKLKETHATSAGLKAFCTWNALETIEKCRASLGGHGYSAYSGLPGMYADQAVQCTWEGDNTILTLQSGRSLVSSYADAVKGQKLPGGTAYLNGLPGVLTASCPSDEATLDLKTLEAGWDTVSANVVRQAYEKFEGAMKSGKGREEALELCSQERFIAARVHTAGYMFRMFHEALVELAKDEPKDNGVIKTLDEICRLYGCWAIEENAAQFLKYKFFTPKQMDIISNEVTSLCAELRKCAVLLTDSFGFTDHIINSPFGRYDGNVYESYYNQVKAANPHSPVAPYFERVIRPLIEREPLELGDDAESMELDDEIAEIQAEREEEKGEAEKADEAEKELKKPAEE
ncbi:acyl-CoA oxidase [Rhodotorula toruloides NP11]|uniref:Acyl-coenzyme A oxidase n=1 Tax=Rhodotorula toruloides (strain NP11) TaxID=1130832 RepID=M7WHA9_RHOT1|nr:acyl-CoA oxidase [Rhodotorula toruloides NP11]EMS19847.1 acyl-CoA oxidase [Rhodotorula toruloides NP11]